MRQKFQIFNSKTIFAPASPASIFFLFAVFSLFFFYDPFCCFCLLFFFCFFFSRLNNLQIEAETGSCRHSDNDNRMLNESFSCHRRSLALAKLYSGSDSDSDAATALCHRRVCWLRNGKMKTNNKREETDRQRRRQRDEANK